MLNNISHIRLSSEEKKLFLSLMIFLICSVLGYFFKAVGQPLLFSVVLRVEVIGGILLFWYSYSKYNHLFSQQTRRWTFFVFVFLILEFGNAMLFAQHRSGSYDFFKWVFFMGMFYIGATPKFWMYFLKWGIIIMIIASVLSAMELIYGGFSYMRGEWSEDSYLYQLQAAYAPIMLLLSYYLFTPHKKYTLITITLFAFFVILQFYFQKRLPLLRIVLTIVVLMHFLRKKSGFTKQFRMIVLLVIVTVVGIVYFLPKQYYEATIDRFFERGTMEQTVEQDARYQILNSAMEATFSSPRTVFFGQGMGGYITGYFWGKKVVVNGNEVDGLATFEIGPACMWFQYGIFFVVLVYGFMARLLFGIKKYKRDSLALSCWVFLLVFFIMNFVGESFPTIHTVLMTATVAITMGYLASFNRRRENTIEI